MKHRDTLIETIQDLNKRGYIIDFNLHSDSLKSNNLRLHPEDFEVKEVYRFEGFSDPADNSVIYAIESKDGAKGILVDAYGTYAEALTFEMAGKLRKK